jgi:hypothetical protein
MNIVAQFSLCFLPPPIDRCANLKEALKKARGRSRGEVKRKKTQHTNLHMHERQEAMNRETKARTHPDR